MTSRKTRQPRRLEFQSLEARQLMHGECIGAMPDVDMGQDSQAAFFARIKPQIASPERSLKTFIQSTRLQSGGPLLVAPPADTIDLYGVIPSLSSDPNADVSIYLDFNGHSEAVWGDYSNIEVPKFDIDGQSIGFSEAEHRMIQVIWARVVEDFAPFNINVTTVEPDSFENGEALRVAIGGRWQDWYQKKSSSGIAGINAFTNSRPNVAFVWSGSMDDWADRDGKEARLSQWIADIVSHEAGHSFGLTHQSSYRTRNGITVKQDEYRTGDSWKGPIMGSTFDSDRSVWYYGQTGPSDDISNQDDMAVIARSTNGFGYRADDHGNTLSNATTIPSNAVTMSGIIGQTNDVDVFRFDTYGGQITVDLDVARLGPNLDARIELWGTSQQVASRSRTYYAFDPYRFLNTPRRLAVSDPTDALDASITMNVDPGTYYVRVVSHGEYGDVGQYRLGGDLNNKPRFAYAIMDPIVVAPVTTFNGSGLGTAADAYRIDSVSSDRVNNFVREDDSTDHVFAVPSYKTLSDNEARDTIFAREGDDYLNVVDEVDRESLRRDFETSTLLRQKGFRGFRCAKLNLVVLVS